MQLIQNEEEFNNLFDVSEQARVNENLLTAIEGYKSLLYYRLVAMNEEGKGDFSNYDAIVIERLGDLAWLFGLTKIANQLFENLKLIGKNVGNEYLYLYLGIKKVSLFVDRGQLEDAFEELQQLNKYFGDIHQITFRQLDKWEKDCQLPNLNKEQQAIIMIRLYYGMGGILLRLGQFEESLLSFKKALKVGKGQSSQMIKSVIFPIKLSICRAYLEKGDVQIALNKLTTLLPKLDKKITSGLYINWLELSAKGNMLIGNFGAAKTNFEEILAACKNHNLTNAQIIAQCNLANVSIYLNQVTTALALLEEAKELAVTIDNKKAVAKIEMLVRLAHLRATSSISNVSILDSFKASASKKRTGNSITEQEQQAPNYSIDVIQTDYYLPYFEDKVVLFHQLLGDFELDHAAKYLQELHCQFQHSDSKLIQYRLKFLQCLLSYYQGDEIAPEILKEIQSYFQTQNLIPELWDFQRLIGWINKDNPKLYEEIQEDNNRILIEMTESLATEDQATYLLNKWTSEEENLATKLNQLEALSEAQITASFFSKFKLSFELYAKLDKLLKELEKYKSFIANKVINNNKASIDIEKEHWLKRLFLHPLNRLEIHFLILPDRAIVIYSGFMFLQYQIVAINRIEVRESVKAVHQHILPFNKTRGFGFKPKPKNLALLSSKIGLAMANISERFKLIEGLDKIPSRIKRLSIIPDDALHGLPFALITYREKYLVEKFAVSIHHKSHPFSLFNRSRKKAKEALLVGITYEHSSTNNQLPGVQKEITLLENLLTQNGFSVKKIEDNTVKKEAILSNAADKKLLHMACHGIFNPKNPDLSGLLLLNGEILSLRDIWQNAQFANIEHVSLSSCWAADNFILPNKWILSLPETLLRAGTESVLGCFWEVSDEVSEKFMEVFYKNLTKHTRDIALQKTQQLAIKNQLGIEGTNTSNLFYWAGFNLFGNTSSF